MERNIDRLGFNIVRQWNIFDNIRTDTIEQIDLRHIEDLCLTGLPFFSTRSHNSHSQH